MTNTVPQSMGARLYRPSAGFQEGSVKNRSRPTCRSAGSASANRKTTMMTTMLAASAAQPRSNHNSQRSVCDRNKTLLPHDVVNLGRARELDEVLHKPFRRRPSHQVERTR